ncbi:MAG: hypothetical protein IPP74_15695 [Alphaproteobacteria bacterium]|nr:hypothetical protein [Alphaproteobacteria bacterium]
MKTNLQDIYSQLETSKSFDELNDGLESINMRMENGKKFDAFLHYENGSFRWFHFKEVVKAKLLGIRTVYDVDPTKTFRIADILTDGALLPHSVTLAELMVMDLEPADDDEEKSETCLCYEYAGDNPLCPDHGDAQEFTQADDRERNDLYTMGMGA